MTSQLYPYAGRHAVQTAAFVLSFGTDIPSERIAELGAAHKALSDVYPSRDVVHAVNFQIGASGPAAPSVKEVGWNFSRPVPVEERDDGKVVAQRSVSIQGADLAIVENDYDRWAGFRATVIRCLDALGSIAFAGRSLASITLQYTDVFIWKGERTEVDAAGIFATDSTFLPHHVFDVGSNYFHATHGYFDLEVPDGAASILENVNVARTPGSASGQDHFVLTIEHKAVPADEHTSIESARTMIESVMDAMHQRNKTYLANLLTAEVQELIRLGG